MIDLDKVPRTAYLQLVELMGKENAELFIKKNGYNFRAISQRIIYLQLRNYFKKKPRLFLLILIIIVALVVLYFLDLFLVI